MKKGLFFIVMVFALFLTGCATHLQYLRVDPNISQYKIARVAVLPFQNALQIPSVNDKADTTFTGKLQNSELFAYVAAPDSVKALMMDNKILNDISNLRQRLTTVGVADPKITAELCSKLEVDALIIGDVTQWNQVESGNSKISTAGLNIKIVAKDGKVLWHGSDSSSYTETVSMFDVAANLVKGGADDSALDKPLEWVIEKMLTKFPGAKS
jgi:hypothetical protein